MDNQQPRINKYLASAGFGSRRRCEDLVREGKVRVNGTLISDLSVRIEPDDDVTVGGKPVHRSTKPVYIMLHKPVGILSSNSDDRGRNVSLNLVRHLHGGHLFSVGRLDMLSSGLLLYTNDGDFAQRLTHPSTGVEREYIVETKEPITEEILKKFQSGIRVAGVMYRCRYFRIHSSRRISLVLSEGRNREIRRVFEHFRIPVTRIHRTRYGSVRLGRLPAGQARFLTESEIISLNSRSPKKSTGDQNGRGN